LQAEVKQLQTEIDRIGNTTEFNTKKLLEGSAKGVKEAVAGSVKLNNNSALTLDMTKLVKATAATATSTKVDGAYMLVKVAATSSTGFTAADFKLIGPNGKEITLAAADINVAATTISVGTNLLGAASTISITSGSLRSDGMNVGDSITLVFGKSQAASSSLGGSLMTQIGANAGQTAFISISDMRSKAIGVDKIDISTKFGAQTAIETVNNAIEKVSSQRSALGALQNRLEHTINNLGTASENLTAAESRVRDVDMAKEMMSFTKNNILQQAATAMLAQANQQPQGVLQLLK